MIDSVHHIAFRAVDFEKTLSFYESLGCKLCARWGEKGNEGAMLEIGNSGVKIELFDKGENFAANGKYRHIAFATDEVDKCYETALANGATSYIPPEDIVIAAKPSPIPARIAFVYGPDGEEIEFFFEKK